MDPTTHEREVTLSGTYAGIQLAAAMIGEKLSANRPRLSGAGLDEDDGLMLETDHAIYY
jgi:hypothetical protein